MSNNIEKEEEEFVENGYHQPQNGREVRVGIEMACDSPYFEESLLAAEFCTVTKSQLGMLKSLYEGTLLKNKTLFKYWGHWLLFSYKLKIIPDTEVSLATKGWHHKKANGKERFELKPEEKIGEAKALLKNYRKCKS